MSRYDRRPLREWDEPKKRRSATQQIGALRLAGLVAILAGSFLVFQRRDAPAPPSSAPRIAVDAALAPAIRERLPKARLTTGTSDELVAQLRGGLTVDAAILSASQIRALAANERCSAVRPVAERGTTSYGACAVNASGSSRAGASAALNAVSDLAGRDALLAAGFDVPENRPTSLSP